MTRRYTRNPDVVKAEAERDAEIVSLYGSGKMALEIAQRFGISRARVGQIVQDSGFAGLGGVRKRAVDRKKAKEDAFRPKWGCTNAQFRTLSKADGRPVNAFRRQKGNARARGIGWQLTLWQWWTIWLESGLWEKRGRGAENYAMCRTGDCGPYAVGNVYIATNSQNGKDRIINLGPISRAAA